MADGPETRITKPESMIFGAKQSTLGTPGDPRERAGQSGSTFPVGRGSYFTDNCCKFAVNLVTFSVFDPSFIESWLRVPIRSRNGARPEAVCPECIVGAVVFFLEGGFVFLSPKIRDNSRLGLFKYLENKIMPIRTIRLIRRRGRQLFHLSTIHNQNPRSRTELLILLAALA